MRTRNPLTLSYIQDQLSKGLIKGYKISSQDPPQKTPNGRIVTKSYKSQSPGLRYITDFLIAFCSQNNLKLLEEYRFDDLRRWRFDFAIVSLKIAVEFEGGIFKNNGGHTGPKHYTKDTEKYNRANELGWKVYRFTALNYKNIHKIFHNINL